MVRSQSFCHPFCTRSYQKRVQCMQCSWSGFPIPKVDSPHNLWVSWAQACSPAFQVLSEPIWSCSPSNIVSPLVWFEFLCAPPIPSSIQSFLYSPDLAGNQSPLLFSSPIVSCFVLSHYLCSRPHLSSLSSQLVSRILVVLSLSLPSNLLTQSLGLSPSSSRLYDPLVVF